MYIESIHTWQFRNLIDGETKFSPGINLLAGANGQGKTNLIEAIYCACLTKSFRTRRLTECIAHEHSACGVRCHLATPPLGHTLEVRLSGAEKELRLDDKAATVTEFLQAVSLLCITADHLRVITEGPEERRRFFDGLIALFHPDFLSNLSAYRRALRQKNTLLRSGTVTPADLVPWNRKLVEEAARLVAARGEFIRMLNPRLERDYFSSSALAIRYLPSLKAEDLQDLEQAERLLAARTGREIERRRCLLGPHLDRYEFVLEGCNVRHFASSGQKRSFLVSLYFAVTEEFRQQRHRFPIMMLDDVDMELDLVRLRRLIGYFDGKTQVFLTTSKPELFENMDLSCQRFQVSTGRIAAVEDKEKS